MARHLHSLYTHSVAIAVIAEPPPKNPAVLAKSSLTRPCMLNILAVVNCLFSPSSTRYAVYIRLGTSTRFVRRAEAPSLVQGYILVSFIPTELGGWCELATGSVLESFIAIDDLWWPSL